MNFFEALHRMERGERVRRTEWPDRTYLTVFWFDGKPVFKLREGINISNLPRNPGNFTLEAADIFATDWEVLKPLVIEGVHPTHVVAESSDGYHYVCANDAKEGTRATLLAVHGEDRWFITLDGAKTCTASTRDGKDE